MVEQLVPLSCCMWLDFHKQGSCVVCVRFFAKNLGYGSSLIDELSGRMQEFEIASRNNWRNLWIETDSMLVVLALESITTVPWSLKNRGFYHRLKILGKNEVSFSLVPELPS